MLIRKRIVLWNMHVGDTQGNVGGTRHKKSACYDGRPWKFVSQRQVLCRPCWFYKKKCGAYSRGNASKTTSAPQKRKKAAVKAAAEEPAGKKAKPDDSKDAGADSCEVNDDDLPDIYSEDEPDKDEDVDLLANVLES